MKSLVLLSLAVSVWQPAGGETSGPAKESLEKFTFERPLMGTRFSIVCHAADRKTARAAAEAAFARAEDVNRVASDYDPESELMRLRKAEADQAVGLSPLLYDLLEHALAVARATNGAYDPTLGPLTRLWRESRRTGELPGPAVLQAAVTASGWRHVILDPEARTVTHRREGMAFDLGGVGKGYAADLMLEALREHGVSRGLIAAGGDIRLGDPPPGRAGWQVALRTFDPDRPDEILTLDNAAVSTSGDLHQAVEIDGVRYAHILDPATGLGLTRRIAASVIADAAKLSDPLATAACVLGPERAGPVREFPGVRELKLRTP